MSKPIQLPEGHKWKSIPDWPAASETAFQCDHCKQTAIHDMIDNSTNFAELESCSEG